LVLGWGRGHFTPILLWEQKIEKKKNKDRDLVKQACTATKKNELECPIRKITLGMEWSTDEGGK